MITNKDIYGNIILKEKFVYPGLEDYNSGGKRKKIDKGVIPKEKKRRS